MAKWLYNLSLEIESPIDIHTLEDTPFVFCCINSNLKMAKWLWEISSNPKIDLINNRHIVNI
jgi:hypothetical protein